MTAALTLIRKYERLVGTQANFSSPYLNPGRVTLWVQTCNHETGSNERPIELDDDEWAVE